jgi:tetratricopeptide (TPR) repeat protein
MENSSTQLIEEGKHLMTKLQFHEAEERFQKALQEDPRSADALVWLGRLALMRDQKDEGVKLIDQALDVQPRNAEALAMKGVYFMQKEDWEHAVEMLEKAKDADPNLEMTYYNLGKSYRKLRQYQLAEMNVRIAIERNAKHFQAHSELSNILGQTGRIKEGIEEMVAAIRINPLYLKGYLVLGTLYQRAGKGNLAIALYKEGLKHNPNAIVLREELCNLFALQLNFRAAMAEALEIVKRRSDYRDYLRVGNLAIALSELETAEKAYKTSIRLNPKSWEGHYNLGELYFAAKLMEQARSEYQEAINYGGNEYKPFNGMGLFVLHVDKDAEKAKKYFTRALELEPTRVEPLFNMALACGVLKEFAAAEKFASSVLKLSRPGESIYAEAEKLLRAIAQERANVKN